MPASGRSQDSTCLPAWPAARRKGLRRTYLGPGTVGGFGEPCPRSQLPFLGNLAAASVGRQSAYLGTYVGSCLAWQVRRQSVYLGTHVDVCLIQVATLDVGMGWVREASCGGQSARPLDARSLAHSGVCTCLPAHQDWFAAVHCHFLSARLCRRGNKAGCLPAARPLLLVDLLPTGLP